MLGDSDAEEYYPVNQGLMHAGTEAELMTPAMYPGLLIRRHIGEPWFKPIARIGSQGSDEYPLNPVDWSRPDETPAQLVAEITARRRVELFLFVNDAVLPVSKTWQLFYSNNQGTATVTVQPVAEPTARKQP